MCLMANPYKAKQPCMHHNCSPSSILRPCNTTSKREIKSWKLRQCFQNSMYKWHVVVVVNTSSPLPQEHVEIDLFLHHGQSQSHGRRLTNGGWRHVICQPRWHISHNNIVVCALFSRQTKHLYPGGAIANSGNIAPPMEKWQRAQFFVLSVHSCPSLC